MKPSDYLITEEDEYKILRERCGKTILDKEIRNNITCIRKELDERFIDKEELIQKIKHIVFTEVKIIQIAEKNDLLKKDNSFRKYLLGKEKAYNKVLKLLEE